jgi:hypothetical protein
MTEEQRVERRMLLRGAGVAGATLVGVAAAPAAATASDRHGHRDSGVVGSWLITHTDDPPGNETGHAVVSFAPGGVMTTAEINPVAPAGGGAWEAHGDSYVATFWTGDPGEAEGQAVVVEVRVRGRVRGDRTYGRYWVSVYDPAGNHVGNGSGRFHGDRIMAH